jgi:peptidoglycan glycosyltransferase
VYRDPSRRDEGSLILLTLLLLWSGAFLVYLAKTRDGIPSNALNVNAASASELERVLGIDTARARRLFAARNRMDGFRYATQIGEIPLLTRAQAEKLAGSRTSVKDLSARELERLLQIPRSFAVRLREYVADNPDVKSPSWRVLARIPLLSAETMAAVEGRLIARGVRGVFVRFAVTAVLLSVLIFLIPALLRRVGVRADPVLIATVFSLCVFGVFAQFSLRDPFRDSVVYGHHAAGLFLGLVGLIIAGVMPGIQSGSIPSRSNLRRYTYLWGVGAILLTVLLLLFGSGPGGVKLSLWFFQPIELVKLLLVLFAAGYLADRSGLLSDSVHRWKLKSLPGISTPRREDIAPLAGLFAIALLLFVAVRDLGPALVAFGAFVALFYVATGRAGIIWAGLLVIVLGAFTAYRLRIGVIPVRIDMWLSPWTNPHANGMQLGQSYWALSSGGLWGTGLGLGMPGTLPRGRDDLVFAVLGEELGLVGSISILVLYSLLITRGFRAARLALTDFDRMLAAGISALFACQVFLVLAGVSGLLPLSGITLPFLGYGNSALVVNLFAAGLLIGISHRPRRDESTRFTSTSNEPLQRAALASSFGILVLVGIGRIGAVQLIRDNATAGMRVRTPDSDGVNRPKTNPRLLAMERRIPRGAIFDREGRTLAATRGAKRTYPYGEAIAHLVGYLDPAVGGPVGMEKEFNNTLRGFRSHAELIHEYRNKDLPFALLFRAPRAGADLHLTVDAELQKKAFAALKSRAAALTDRRTGGRKNRASMVMTDPSTGEVLIAVSLPSFDPNGLTVRRWRTLMTDSAKEARLFDRARMGAYPPGSSLKVATAAAALEAGLEPVFSCAHVAHGLRWKYDGRTYVREKLTDDEGDPPHGRVALPEGLRHSCNIYFARLGMTLGVGRLQNAFEEQFGLRYTKAGRVFAKDLPLNAIGQGTMLASPMEMARIAASVANRGIMLQPRFVKEIRDRNGRSRYSGTPSIMARPIGELNASKLAEMMRSVVTDGTARGVFGRLPVEVAGKTGTAETDEGDRQPHSWFIGFTPFSKPQYAFACIIENGGYGKRGAAPAVNDVLQEVFRRSAAR